MVQTITTNVQSAKVRRIGPLELEQAAWEDRWMLDIEKQKTDCFHSLATLGLIYFLKVSESSVVRSSYDAKFHFEFSRLIEISTNSSCFYLRIGIFFGRIVS